VESVSISGSKRINCHPKGEEHMLRPFHLALPTKDIKQTEAFYTKVLGCEIGRRDTTWIDFNFLGHQVVFHEDQDIELASITNSVDSKQVRVPHFGVVLTMEGWKQTRDRLESINTTFIIAPYIRFEGEAGAQATMFFEDNNGYAIEIKAFKDDTLIFKA